jgi:hypothetical protein
MMPKGRVMAGRPTEYDPAFCDLVVEWGASGKSLTWMAAELDVSRECVYEWARTHAEFSDALTRARAKSQKWWEDAGQTAMMLPGFNGSVWAKSMAARFPADWRENKGVELTGAGGGPVQTALTIEFVDAGSVPKQT